MGWFGSKAARPERWTELWEVLTPFGGSLDPSGARSLSAETVPVPTLRRANVQLREAYRLLNTEALARATGEPYSAPGRPFAYRRFLRVIDDVVLAGPEVVRRVADDASAIQSYDSLQPLDPAVFYDDLLPTEPPLLTVLRGALDAAWPPEQRPTGPTGWHASLPAFGPDVPKSWPSLTDRTFGLIRADPSVPWLEFVSELDEGDAAGQPGCWEFSGYQAGKGVFAALGPDPHAVVPGVRDVMVEFATPGGPPPQPTYQDGGNVVACVSVLTAPELATSDPGQRVTILIRRGAQAMLRLRLSEPARERLTALAEH